MVGAGCWVLPPLSRPPTHPCNAPRLSPLPSRAAHHALPHTCPPTALTPSPAPRPAPRPAHRPAPQQKHIDDVPELKAEKQAMNRRTLKAMQVCECACVWGWVEGGSEVVVVVG